VTPSDVSCFESVAEYTLEIFSSMIFSVSAKIANPLISNFSLMLLVKLNAPNLASINFARLFCKFPNPAPSEEMLIEVPVC